MNNSPEIQRQIDQFCVRLCWATSVFIAGVVFLSEQYL